MLNFCVMFSFTCFSAKRFIQGPWKQEVTESTFKPGRYDLPAVGAAWLSNFLRQNPGKLQDLKVNKSM